MNAGPAPDGRAGLWGKGGGESRDAVCGNVRRLSGHDNLADIGLPGQSLGMECTAAHVITEIEAVFPNRRSACFDPMINGVQGDEPRLTAVAFSDKDDWTQLESKWLDEAPNGWASALSFLADEAVCFYIPAFMSADLRGELERVEPVFHLVHGFDDFSRDQRIYPRRPETWTDYGKRRWSNLTFEQASAVVHYLEWRIKKDGSEVAIGASEALSAFWYDRADTRYTGT